MAYLSEGAPLQSNQGSTVSLTSLTIVGPCENLTLDLFIVDYHVMIETLSEALAIEALPLKPLYRVESACVDQGMHSYVSATRSPHSRHEVLLSLIELSKGALCRMNEQYSYL